MEVLVTEQNLTNPSPKVGAFPHAINAASTLFSGNAPLFVVLLARAIGKSTEQLTKPRGLATNMTNKAGEGNEQ